MSLTELISVYQSKSRQLRASIENQIDVSVKRLDIEVNHAFEAILDFEPSNHEATAELATFLIDMLYLQTQQSDLENKLKSKLEELIVGLGRIN